MCEEFNENDYDERTVDLLLDEVRKERSEKLSIIENSRNRILSFTSLQPILFGLYVSTFIIIGDNHSISEIAMINLVFALGSLFFGIIIGLFSMTPLSYPHFSIDPDDLYGKVNDIPIKVKNDLLQTYFIQQKDIQKKQKFYPKALTSIILILILSLIGYISFTTFVFIEDTWIPKLSTLIYFVSSIYLSVKCTLPMFRIYLTIKTKKGIFNKSRG